MKRIIAAASAAWLAALSPSGAAIAQQKKTYVRTIPTNADGVQLVYGQVTNPDPANFMVNFNFASNAQVDKRAPFFAVYFSPEIPPRCADYRDTLVPGNVRDHVGTFDLRREMPLIMDALNRYQCIVVSNTETLKPR